MTNVCRKSEHIGPNQTLVIDRTRLYTTDRWTNGHTGAKQYIEEGVGGGKKNLENKTKNVLKNGW